MLSEYILLKILDFIDWMPWSTPWDVHGIGTALHRSAEHGDMSSGLADSLRSRSAYREYFGFPANFAPSRKVFANRESKPIMAAHHHPDGLLEIDLDLYVACSMTGPIIEMMKKSCRELESKIRDAIGPSRIQFICILDGPATRLRKSGCMVLP